MAIKVFWTENAIRQRNYILEYWNKRNGSTRYSRKIMNKTKKQISLLKAHPKIGKETVFIDKRIIPMGDYSLIYKYTDTLITIVGFWDNRQDPQKLHDFLSKE